MYFTKNYFRVQECGDNTLQKTGLEQAIYLFRKPDLKEAAGFGLQTAFPKQGQHTVLKRKTTKRQLQSSSQS